MTAWDDELVPPRLVALGRQVRAAFDLPATAIGHKGDASHTYGYHRSRRWILTDPSSDYGSDDYSVVTELDRGGDQNWICAIDITPSSVDQMITLSKRLDAAMRADRLPDVREFYGNVDGDQVVDGWDDLTHRAATSDSSHLWHIHASFYRSRADNDHTDVLRVLTGAEEDDMSDRSDQILAALAGGVPKLADGTPVSPVVWRIRDEARQVAEDTWRKTVDAKLNALAKPAPVTLSAEDRAAIVAELAGLLPGLLGAVLARTGLVVRPAE